MSDRKSELVIPSELESLLDVVVDVVVVLVVELTVEIVTSTPLGPVYLRAEIDCHEDI